MSGTALALILLAVGFCSWLNAYSKAFWYDEIITVILSRLPNSSEIWTALDHSADTNPPLFYFVARMARQLLADDHLGYRLPSIVGLLGTILCLYVVLSKRVDRLSALVGATFILCTPLAGFAAEARPYALMLGCVAAAIVAWQRIETSRIYCVAVAIALAAALSLHYYAILVWPAFVLAEALVWVSRRSFRAGTWIALAAGAAPLFVFSGLLLHLRQYYGSNFWARPAFGQIFFEPSYLFNVLGYWGFSFTLGAIVILVTWSAGKTVISGQRATAEDGALTIEECGLTVALLVLPFIAIVAAKVGGGGMTGRYLLPTVIGGALAVGYLTSKANYAVRALLLGLMLVNYGLSSTSIIRTFVNGSLLESRAAATREVKAILAGYQESGLPIVISSGTQYLPMAYYMPPDQNVGVYALVDPPAAVTFAKTDSVDLALVVLRQYFPLKVEYYRKFATKHREFILISKNGTGFDWWPSRLSHEGHTLTLVSSDGNAQVYKVVLDPQTF
jgi:hypothetical protein